MLPPSAAPAFTAAPQSARAARTRAALVGAGLDLLADRPVEAISVDELVGAAGVAKGSFFNHFADKQAFAAAIAETIRADLETRVAAFNAAEADPLQRLTGGMIVAAAFAASEPRRTMILSRHAASLTPHDHALNDGVVADLGAVIAAGLASPGGERGAVLFWLGCCHTLISALIMAPADHAAVVPALADMLRLALRGLGVAAPAIAELTRPDRLAARLDRALHQPG